jgi:hypothetical protein
MRFCVIVITFFAFSATLAQTSLLEFTAAIGESSGTISVLGERDWQVGEKKNFIIGGGVRLTSFMGSDRNFITAPAKLTSGSTGPLVIFKENIEENIDTLRLGSVNANSLNLFINLRYQLSKKLSVGFNIDAIGFSFGKKKRGTFINNENQTDTEASVTSFNVLLISDNDRGSLNSEFYVRYNLKEDWSLKGGAQFVFIEYTTDTDVQQFPEPNDRFRLKSLLFAVGISRKF